LDKKKITEYSNQANSLAMAGQKFGLGSEK